ncbi:uncharacterized protein [Parasteatoda tepidariorum]|uniref:uncharacterized protein n=1 Tax=Parasteatoda tepidariorum TaxID=114398 RepID=UPI001C728A60|nr:uncharacterized protein LOC107441570 [Parasteatoda tepidariorum]
MVKKEFLYLTLPLVFTTVVCEECTLHQLHGCLTSLQSVTQGNDLALVTTRLQLQAVCRTLKDSVSCVDDHMKHCFTPTQRQVFNHVVAGARQFLLELCVPGSIQDAYLKHSPCYKNVSLSEEKCAPLYRHLVQLSAQVDKNRDVDDRLRESCCTFNDFVVCKYTYVSQDCGQDAARFLQQHLDQISSPLIQEHCAHYTYGADSCTSTSFAQSLFEQSFALLSLPMIIALNRLKPTR